MDETAPRKEVCTDETAPRIDVCTDETAPRIVCTDETAPRIEVCTDETAPRIEVCTGETSPRIVCTDETAPRIEVCTDETAPRIVCTDESVPHVVCTGETAPRIACTDETAPHIVGTGDTAPRIVCTDETAPRIEVCTDETAPHIVCTDDSDETAPRIVCTGETAPRIVCTDGTAPRIVCTTCLRDKGETVETLKYCVQCNENLCKPCLKQHIKKTSSASKSHTLLSRDQMPLWMTRACGVVQGSDNCEKHPANSLDMYCHNHEMFTCGACAVLDHKSCDNVIDIAESLSEENVSASKEQVIAEIKETDSAIKYTIQCRKNDQSKARKATTKSLARVREFRETMNNLFDKLEKETVDEINTFCLDHDDKVEKEIRVLERQGMVLALGTQTVVRQHVDQEETSNFGTVLDIENSRKIVLESKALCEEKRKSAKETPREFNISPSLQRYLESLKSLGEFTRERLAKYENTVEIRKLKIGCESDKNEIGSMSAAPFHLRKLLVTDTENRNISVLDEHFSILRCINLNDIETKTDENESLSDYSYEPYSITQVSEDSVAVSFEQAKTVKLITIADEKCGVFDIHVEEICRGLAYNELYDELYVCCGGGSFLSEGLGHLRVYRLTGKLERVFKTSSPGKQQLFSCPMDVAVSNCGSSVYISDTNKGVLAIDRQGRLLSTFTSSELHEPRGICVDVDDHVLVCGYVSNNVIQLDKKLEDFHVLLDEATVSSPHSITFIPFNSKCVLTMNNSKEIVIFKSK